MRGGLALLLMLGAAAGPVAAKTGTPGPFYFAGSYDRIGRGGGEAAEFLNDRVLIVPEGQSVAIRACAGPDTLMGFGPAFEVENLMTGARGDVGVECLFHNNGYNRPILTCRAQDGGAFTLWPVIAGADAVLDCG